MKSQISTYLICTALLLFLSACGGEEEDKGFQIPGTPMSFPTVEVHEGPMPEETFTGNEPIIESYKFERVAPGRGVLNMEISGGPLEVLFFEFDDVIYKIWPDPLDAEIYGDSDYVKMWCDSNLQANGVGCDQRCIDACDCVTCEDRDQAEMIVGSCATACTLHLEDGMIPSEMYDSIPDYVDKMYYGFPEYEIKGMLNSSQYDSAQCSGGAACRVYSDSGEGNIRPAPPFEFYIPDINAPCCAVAQDAPPQDRGTLSGANGLTQGTLSRGRGLSCSPPLY